MIVDGGGSAGGMDCTDASEAGPGVADVPWWLKALFGFGPRLRVICRETQVVHDALALTRDQVQRSPVRMHSAHRAEDDSAGASVKEHWYRQLNTVGGTVRPTRFASPTMTLVSALCLVFQTVPTHLITRTSEPRLSTEPSPLGGSSFRF